MAILSRVKISPQQRYDLEDLFAEQAAERADEKLYTQKFLSESNLVLSGFIVSGIGLSSATVGMTGCALIIPQNTTDFAYFISAPTEPDVVIPDADLVDGTRNYLEVELATQDATPLTKAFWDPEANSGNGAEFNQIVNTVTDLKVNFVVSTGGFSGLPNRLPIAIIDTNGSGIIKLILDRRQMYGRLAQPTNLDNEYAWGTKVDPVYNLNMSGAAGVFVAGESITIGGETATVVSGGTASITFNCPTGINFQNGSSVLGLTSGATGTVNTILESFVGVDKSLKGQKMINDALMTEFKKIKNTRFWWQTGPSLVGLKTEMQSLIAPISSGAKIKWDGSKLAITDDSLAPATTDNVAAIRVLSSVANLYLRRMDDGKEVTTITLSDVPTAGTLTLDQAGFLIAIPRTANTAAIQAAWNSSGAYAATISGSPADGKIVITANAAGLRTDIIVNANTYTKSGSPVTPNISIKQGMVADSTIALADGQALYVDLSDPLADTNYSGVGAGATNFKVAARGSLAILDKSFWLAYREGAKLVFRGAGELQAGETSQISDNVPQGLLDAIGLTDETSLPSYTSNIRGSQNESIVKRASVLTDAMGDEQEDRSGYLRSDDVVTWTGTQVEFTQPIVLEFINTKTGAISQHSILAASSPIVIADQESIYCVIDRTVASETVTLLRTTVTPIPAQTQANKDIFVLFRRIDALGAPYVHIPFHKQVLEAGQSVHLGASGSGSGGGDSLAGDYKRRLVLSPFTYVTPNVFETTKATLVDGASTGSFNPAKKAFSLPTIGNTFVSSQMLDADFLDDLTDLNEVELWLDWLTGFVDTGATYEVSRNGGLNWQVVPMTRVGTSGSYRGYWAFTDEPSLSTIDTYSVANADAIAELNASTTQSRAQSIVLSATQVVKELTMYFNKVGSPAGTFTVSVVKDSAGLPSTALTDYLYTSQAQQLSLLASGNSAVVLADMNLVLPAGTYHLVVETSAAYKSSFSTGVTALALRIDSSASTAPGRLENYNGSAWALGSATQDACYLVRGRPLDLRVRVTSSITNTFINGYGIFYGVLNGIAPLDTKLVQRFFFNGSTNPTQFTLNWTPDPDLLEAFDPYRGQVYVAADGVFRINGTVVTFAADTFNDPGEDILLIFRQVKGTSFDSSAANANAIASNTNNLTDVGDEFASMLDSDAVILPKIPAPFTTVVNRALIPDLSQDLAPRFGQNIVPLNSIYEIQEEQGPNGEKVFGLHNDVLGLVRFVGGGWANGSNADGTRIVQNTVGDYMEVTFRGTGLVLWTYVDSGSRLWSYAVDGGSTVLGSYPSSGSGILNGRNYNSCCPQSVVQGLAYGTHTVRIIGSSGGGNWQGYEVINDSAGIRVPQGSQYLKGKKITHLTDELISYNTGFETGTLGTKGANVLIYQKSDGTVAKACTPTDAAALFLTQTSHANEEVLKTTMWREFGASRSDDFSYMGDSAGTKTYTCDDGTMNLRCSAARMFEETVFPSTTGDFIEIQFEGTGLDVYFGSASAYTMASQTVTVDNVSVGTIPATALPIGGKLIRIASGLTMGTHIVRFTEGSGGSGNGFRYFQVYAPKKPTLPTNSAPLGQYYIQGNVVIAGAAGAQTISQGVRRRQNTRHFVMTGTWSDVGYTASTTSGRYFQGQTSGGYLETIAHCTGFDLRVGQPSSTHLNTVTLNGVTLTAANFPTATFSVVGSLTFNSATGQISIPNAGGDGQIFQVKGLPLANYIIRFTLNNTAGFNFECLDLHAPIYSMKTAGPTLIQNTNVLGQGGVHDQRRIARRDRFYRSGGMHIATSQTASSPTTSITTMVPLQDMLQYFYSEGGWYELGFQHTWLRSQTSQDSYYQFAVDQVFVGEEMYDNSATAGNVLNFKMNHKIYLAKGWHHVAVHWRINGSGGTATSVGPTRRLFVTECTDSLGR